MKNLNGLNVKITMLMGLLFTSTIAAQAGTLAAHRALYELEISRIDNKSGYTNVDGKLAYELKGSPCEGYAVNYRLANRYVLSDKGPRLIDTQLTTWESGDGLEMNLSQKQFIDQQLESEQRFNIKRPKMGEVATGAFTLPKQEAFSIQADAIFPSTHQAMLLDKAKNGTTRDVSLVFDGSDGDKVFKAITFIGKKRPPGTFAVDNNNPETEALRMLASWPMTISYYQNDDSSDEPIYQAGFNMYENGVSTDLTMDYGSYALKGRLTKLDLIKTDTCK